MDASKLTTRSINQLMPTYVVGDFHGVTYGVNLSDNTNDTSGNATEGVKIDPTLIAIKKGNDIMTMCVLVIIMVGMGCSIVPRDLLKPLKRPITILLCFFAQFGIMPLLAFAICHATQPTSAQSLGTLVIASAPGGPAANLFTLITAGDIPLSLCLTPVSTLLSMGFLPLCMYVYTRSWTDSGVVIPFENIAIALAMVIIPPILGMIIRRINLKLSMMVGKIAGIIGMLGIIGNLVLMCFINPRLLISSWQGYFLAIIIPLVGYGSCYLLCLLFKRPRKQANTAAFNCCMKNVPVAITLISLSYSHTEFAEIIMVPLLYGIFSFLISSCLSIVIKRRCQPSEDVKHRIDSFDEDAEDEVELIFEFITVL
ncbi:ileal sodium/bile acid cotransporter-like [Glandiceps talaboti]